MAQETLFLSGADRLPHVYVQRLLTHCHIKEDYLLKAMQH